jgi:hypothetical protein
MSMNIKLNYLKVKIKELAGEGKIIRRDEIKADRKYKEMKTRRKLYKLTEAGVNHSGATIKLLRHAILNGLNLAKAGFVDVYYNVYYYPHKSVEPRDYTISAPNPPKLDWINYQHQLKCNLKEHRKTVVRNEVRASLIAYAYLRDKPFSFVEKNTDLRTIHPTRTRNGVLLWDAVQRNVRSFTSEKVSRDVLSPWCVPDTEQWYVDFIAWRNEIFEKVKLEPVAG